MRYKKIFKPKSATEMIGTTYTIENRSSDIYMTYNSSDRLDLISHRVYGDPQYWWIILAANNYSIEFDIESGEILRIPFPLSSAISDIRKSL